MWTCARLATARSASANARPSRNSLKPCFVDIRTGTRAIVPGDLPVRVRVDEVRVEDLRPLVGQVADEADERDAGRRRAEIGIGVERHARGRAARGRSPTRRARSRAASAAARPSRARAAAAAARADAPPSLRCRRPSARAARAVSRRAHLEDGVGPVLDRVVRCRRARAAHGRRAARASGGMPASVPILSASPAGSSRANIRRASRPSVSSSKTGFDTTTGRQLAAAS